MAKLEALSHVGIFTRDQARARTFFTEKVGLRVRGHLPHLEYVSLGTRKTGDDASLVLWQPDPKTWGMEYEPAAAQIGGVTGVGFRTTAFDRTVDRLRQRGVRVDSLGEEGGGRFGRFLDADGNTLFLAEPRRPRERRVGLERLDFVTAVTRDMDRATAFFTEALGMKAKRGSEEGSVELRLRPRGTSLLPFMPIRENYEDAADYEDDLAHIGENTWIFFTTDDIHGMQETLLNRGVRFKRKAEPGDWGGLEAEFFDPDDNVYWLTQPGPSARSRR